MGFRKEKVLPDQTTELRREKTAELSRNTRTGLYTVLQDTLDSVGEYPGAQSRRRRRALTASLVALFRKNRRDVDSLVVSQLVTSNPKPVDWTLGSINPRVAPVNDVYNVGPVFAEGGQGVLHLAKDRELYRQVAIKSLKNSQDPKQREAFLREARITAQLDHPAVTPIYGLNTDSGHAPHLVMPYIKGYTLKQYLERLDSFYRIDGIRSFDERRSLFFRLDLFLRVCDALSYAHSRNVMHCDLKPDNIMIGEFREVHVMDWGIARMANDPDYDPATWRAPHKIMGTPRYLSPEAVRGAHCDARSDIYALGLILFEVVTLQEGYTGHDSSTILQNVAAGKINPCVHRYGAKIDSDLESVIAKATEPDPDQRYQTVAELAADVRRYIRNEELSARPDGIFSKIFRWCSRNPKWVTAIIFCILLFAAASVIYSLTGRIRMEQTASRRDFSVNMAFGRCVFSARKLDTLITQTENLLLNTAQYLQIHLPKKTPSDETFSVLPHTAFRRADAVPPFAEAYQRNVSFRNGVWRTMDGELTSEQKHILTHIQVMQPFFLQSITKSSLNEPGKARKRITENEIRKHGMPLHLIVFGFEDGLFYMYPGAAGQGESYDPRTRNWYIIGNAITDGQPRWTMPYTGAHAKTGLLLGCSLPISDAGKKNKGVIAAEMQVSALLREMQIPGDFLKIEPVKLLLNSGQEPLLITENSSGDHPIPQKMSRMMQSMSYGTYLQEEEDILWCFSKISSVNWYYIEKYPFSQLEEFCDTLRHDRVKKEIEHAEDL